MVVGYDPLALAHVKAEVPALGVAADPYDAAAGAHCAVVCTECHEFQDLDLERLKQVMGDPVVVDGRNIFEPEAMRRAGVHLFITRPVYYPTGRPVVT
jgi:UDPglucose 6-dehydrogenase